MRPDVDLLNPPERVPIQTEGDLWGWASVRLTSIENVVHVQSAATRLGPHPPLKRTGVGVDDVQVQGARPLIDTRALGKPWRRR